MLGGYMGKILRVNLATRKISVEPLKEELARDYVGCYGTAGRILYDEVPRWADALDPLNELIFSVGPVTGTITQTAGRHTVVTKSPMTGYFGDASAGGFWGAELKFAGFDMIVLTGRPSKPTYLWINDRTSELKDASAYWGMNSREFERALRKDLGDSKIQISEIGQGGENQVKFAAIMHDEAGRAAGRCGVGAVMGFMNLKAVAVRGHMKVPVHDEEALKQIMKEVSMHYKNDKNVRGFHGGGTAGGFEWLWEIGDTPGYNWADDAFGIYDSSKVSWPGAFEKIVAGTRSCYLCGIACRRVSSSGPDGPYNIEHGVEGVEYENLAMLGSDCGVDDIYAINKANDLCNIYGLDTISTGSTIAFAMECYHRGLIDRNDTDGVDLRFGNGDAMIEMIHKIANREGFGNILAEGARRAAKIIGKGAEKYAIQIKGLELAAHDPRAFQSGGVHYATTITGGRHTEACPCDIESGRWAEFGYPDPLDRFSTEGKARVAKVQEDWWSMINVMGWCLFADGRSGNRKRFVDAYTAVTGISMDLNKALLVGERIFNLRKAFNMKHGCTREEDTLPERLLKKPNRRANGAVVKLDEMLPEYYQLRGWDPKTSIPTRAKLESLGLGDIADDFWPRA